MISRKIVCFCQDVTEEDLVRSIEAGYDHPETLKRFTGVFMGPCQGKMCATNVLRLLAARTGKPLEALRPPTLRPPLEPVPLGALAAIDEDEHD